MTKENFRNSHILKALNGYKSQNLPIDRYLSGYFRANKSLGSKDRAYISEAIYTIMRWKGLFDHLSKDRLKSFLTVEPLVYLQDETIAKHTRLSTPKFLYDLLVKEYGEKKTEEICLAINTQAPITIRVNTHKTTREKLFEKLQENYPCKLCEESKQGIIFDKRINFLALEEFKQGFFEVQDEGSQLLAEQICATANDSFLDYCAGSGGKALAIAPLMEGKGQIYLHDIREHALLEAKKRFKRASLENYQILFHDEIKKKKRLKKKIDFVLVDAPCSGTGTLRRNCDFKWKLNQKMIDELALKQRTIFKEALSYLKEGGTIVYATCSLLREENEDQVKYFLENFPLKLVKPPFKTTLQEGGMDAFFAASFKLCK